MSGVRRLPRPGPELTPPICGCGSTEVFAIKTGFAGERRGAIDLFTWEDPLVDRPIADQAWCRLCWDRRFVAAVT